MNQATFNDGRRTAKNPEAESFLMELPHARQPTLRNLYFSVILNLPRSNAAVF
jgi:Fe2+ transport system protein B